MLAPRHLASMAVLVLTACTPQCTSIPALRDAHVPVASAPPAEPLAPAPPAAAVVVTGPADAPIVALAPGVHHTCALRGGQVFCWGSNPGGILGVEEHNLEAVLQPRRVPGLERVIEVVADSDYTCAVDDSHAVYCWGDNDRGQLGSGDTARRTAPTRIAGLAADRLFAGYGRACAAVGAGFRCWGSGELGDGVAHHRQSIPLEIGGLAGADDLALSEGNACILKAGTIRCWGENASGQLGNGEGGCRYEREPCPTGGCLPPRECKHAPQPVDAVGLPRIVEVEVGGSHTHVRAVDGTIWVTGQQGVTMDYGADNLAYRPRPIVGLPAMIELDAGASHACALTAGGEVWCWGNNAFGQLGHPPGPRGGQEPPQRITSLPLASALALGFYFSCALTGTGADAQVWCWGDNGRGQLGDGTTERRHTPVRVRWE
ncbi:RCC1 domain-containing protein [Nannocystis pusilla]|uniref:RCC1 domain-containing protein n=1 Tax=Nannocystis pusilla TaxID=889268 RepID=UPI003DA2B67E